MKKHTRFIGAYLLALLAIAAIWHAWIAPRFVTEVGAGNAPIRIGTNRALGTVVPYVANDLGLYQKQGLRAKIVDFNDVTTLMEAFSSGQIDVAMLGIAPSAIWQAKGVPLKVVASANGGGHVLMTRQGTGIHTLGDLAGKKVATPKPGTVTDTLFRASLMRDIAHLDPDKDIQIVPNMAAADMPTVLFASREVDAAITWEPYASQAEAKYKNAVVLYDAAAEWRKSHPADKDFYPVNVVIARQDLIDNHPDILRKFLSAHVATIDYINRHPAEANPLIATALQLDPAIVTAARRRIDFTSHVNVAASLTTLEWAHSLGYLKAVPQPSTLFDLRFLPKESQQ
jgi:NitT/TauT family transport system substrate-binding protein